jgi:hypothetical protein
VLLVPHGRSLGGVVAEVQVGAADQLGAADLSWAVGRTADELGIADELEAWRFSTEERPLVLSVSRGEAWYERVRLLLTENQISMLFALARSSGWMKTIDLGKKIAPTADYPDQVVRKARLNLEERLVESFKTCGARMPAKLSERLVSFDRTLGYKLGIGATVR